MAANVLTKEQITTFETMIKDSIIANEALKAKLLLAKLSKLKTRQKKQVLRYLLQFFLLKSYTFKQDIYRHARKKNLTLAWSTDLETIQLIFAKKMIDILITLTNEGNFEPTKVITINSLSMWMLALPPEHLEYLLSTGILRLSKSFRLHNTQTSFQKKIIENTRYQIANPASIIERICEEYNCQLELIVDIIKRKFLFLMNYIYNLENLANYKNDTIFIHLLITTINIERNKLFQDLSKIIGTTKDNFYRNFQNNQLFTKIKPPQEYTQDQLNTIDNYINNEITEILKKLHNKLPQSKKAGEKEIPFTYETLKKLL
jgi:hypothetical protein